MPNAAAESSIHCPNVVRHRKIENAVHFERSRFDRCAVRPKSPGERERVNVSRIDLVERTETLARIVAIVRWPGIGWRFEQHSGVELLSQSERQMQTQRKD